MKIGFCYDRNIAPKVDSTAEDLTAEYETLETIEALKEALLMLGDVIELPWHQDLFYDLQEEAPDLVFNITESHGSRNRESYVPNLCEILEIPCTGSDGLALGISLAKDLTKHIARSVGISTPDFHVISKISELNNLELEFPLFIKPNSEGSSMGIRRNSLVKNMEELKERTAHILKTYRGQVIVEDFVPGREFVVSILGNEKPKVFPLAEIIVESGNVPFYSFEYKGEHKKEIICPVDLDQEKEEVMISSTLKLYHLLACRDLARTDFKLDEQGRPLFLEINPLPGLSPFYSVYPYQAEKAGLSHQQLVARIVEAALNRK